MKMLVMFWMSALTLGQARIVYRSRPTRYKQREKEENDFQQEDNQQQDEGAQEAGDSQQYQQDDTLTKKKSSKLKRLHDNDDDQQEQQQDEGQAEEQGSMPQSQNDQQDQQQQDQQLDDLQQDSDDKDGNYEQFSKQYSNNYNQQQLTYRYKVYEQNQQKVKQHNQNNKDYAIKINRFADQTKSQFLSLRLMQLMPGQRPPANAPMIKKPENFEQNRSPIDWKEKTSRVKYQGKCGSCWALSIVASVQAIYYMNFKQRLQLSAQHLVDCCKSGCNGCSGGWPEAGLKYAVQNGFALQQEYPYTGARGKCNQNVATRFILNKQRPFRLIQPNYKSLIFAIHPGPVPVVVDASTWDPLYSSGVFSDCPEDNFIYNHAVVVVAVDMKGVWTVRNSWGPQWGDEGHIYLPAGNSCGIADMSIVPVLT